MRSFIETVEIATITQHQKKKCHIKKPQQNWRENGKCFYAINAMNVQEWICPWYTRIGGWNLLQASCYVFIFLSLSVPCLGPHLLSFHFVAIPMLSYKHFQRIITWIYTLRYMICIYSLVFFSASYSFVQCTLISFINLDNHRSVDLHIRVYNIIYGVSGSGSGSAKCICFCCWKSLRGKSKEHSRSIRWGKWRRKTDAEP